MKTNILLTNILPTSDEHPFNSAQLIFLFCGALIFSLSCLATPAVHPAVEASCLEGLSSESILGGGFLSSRYSELADETSVIAAAREYEATYATELTKPSQRLSVWLESLSQSPTDQERPMLERLRDHFHKTYVVKKEEIPENYYLEQMRLGRELGHGNVIVSDKDKEHLAEHLVNDQKASLDKWFDYFVAESSPDYPVWIKYWTLMELVKLGKYNSEQGSFSGRPTGTVALFPELNRAAFSKLVDLIVLRVSKKSLPEAADPVLVQLLKRKKFGNLYGRALQLESGVQEGLEVTQGQWVTYKQGSDHMKLVDDISGKATGWCTVGEKTAEAQLKAGDFHVYFSDDSDGNPTKPRLAIRMEGTEIAEVRGVAKDQNIDGPISATSILDEKLASFGVEGEKYLVRSAHMKFLIEIETKTKAGLELTRLELRFLYEIEEYIQSFGYDDDPRIDEIKIKRDEFKDYAVIFGVRESEVTDSEEKIFSGAARVFVGEFKIFPGDELSKLRLVAITGNAYLNVLTDAQYLSGLEYIGGSAHLQNIRDSKGLSALATIKEDANFNKLEDSSHLTALTYIGSTGRFTRLTNSKGLSSLTTFGHDANFPNLLDDSGLTSLASIGRHATFAKLKDASRLLALRFVGGESRFPLVPDRRLWPPLLPGASK